MTVTADTAPFNPAITAKDRSSSDFCVPRHARCASTSRRTSCGTPFSLDSVLEHAAGHNGDLRRPSWPPPAETRHSSAPSHKGKEVQSESASECRGHENGAQQRRAPWVVDVLEVQREAQNWAGEDKVILVLDAPSVDALSPILYNPAFAGSLLLVASTRPLPFIEATTPPCGFPSAPPHAEIFPTVEVFSLPLHPRFGESTNCPPCSKRLQISRAPSDRTSPGLGGITIRLIHHKAPPCLARYQVSISSLDMDQDALSAPEDIVAPARSHLSYFSRSRFPRGPSKQTRSETIRTTWQQNGSPFDAIINFIPSANTFQADGILQNMLHQSVVTTIGVVPYLARKAPGSTFDPISSVSLVHVLPTLVPKALPVIIESFLLSMMPAFQNGNRQVWGAVVSTAVWQSPNVDIVSHSQIDHSTERVSGAEILLYGRVRCSQIVREGSGEPRKSRAFLGNWNACVSMPGLLVPNLSATQSAASSARRVQALDVIIQLHPPWILRDRCPSPPIEYETVVPAYPSPHYARLTSRCSEGSPGSRVRACRAADTSKSVQGLEERVPGRKESFLAPFALREDCLVGHVDVLVKQGCEKGV
ncbi:hypothetical protein EHS25_001714 [Saitozyma podzolica]|uniref:Uncharacterized protein n=1 Tax=Saitozyma podzolica TaxID=1890683 RepID=A0A427YEX3_9TREE|nr:hypothetical protein EHS25_001714 [Saitozyma podzolica]